MSYEDRIRIETPEGVDLELTLAGLGSRIAAALLDALIRGAMYLAIFVITALAAGASSTPVLMAVLIPMIFLIEVGYDIAFETLGSGRTIGKRAAGLRVVRIGGAPIDFRSSAVRNVLRLVDGLLTSYVAGVVSILVTSRNQRLGDLAAGTIVVRERSAVPEVRPIDYVYASTRSAVRWDVSAVSVDETATLRRFLERRTALTGEARSRVARDLAGRLRAKVAGAPERIHPEAFIEEVVRAKSGRDEAQR